MIVTTGVNWSYHRHRPARQQWADFRVANRVKNADLSARAGGVRLSDGVAWVGLRRRAAHGRRTPRPLGAPGGPISDRISNSPRDRALMMGLPKVAIQAQLPTEELSDLLCCRTISFGCSVGAEPPRESRRLHTTAPLGAGCGWTADHGLTLRLVS